MSEDIPDNYHVISENKVQVPGGGQCPGCLARMDGATAIDVKKKIQPKPGDMGVCCFCGVLLTYEEKLTSHIATEDELASLPPEMRETLERHSSLFKEVAKRRAHKDTIGVIIKLPS
jgi:hypothetical protein